MKRIGIQLHGISRSARTSAGRVLAICALMMIAAPHARAAASLVSLKETWNNGGTGIQNPSAITFVPGSTEQQGTFFIADVTYTDDEDFASSRLVALGADLLPTGSAIDLASITQEPTGLAFHPNRRTFFITDDDEVELYEVDLHGRRLQTIDLSDLGASDPEGVACDTANDILFIADGRAQRILEITTDGDLVRAFSVEDIPGFREAEGIEYDPRNGHLYVATGKSGVLFELTRGGTVVAAFDMDVLGAKRPRGVTLGPPTDTAGSPDDQHLFIVDDVAKKQPRGRLLEIAIAQRPTGATYTANLVGDVDGFGFDGTEPGFAIGDLDHNGLLERGEQLPSSFIGAKPADEALDTPTDLLLVTREGAPIVIHHAFDLGSHPHPEKRAEPTWARLTLVIGDARTLAGTRNVVLIDGRRVGEVVGSTQKKLKAGAIATTVIELAPAVLSELADGSARIEIARDPGTGSDDIMIDYSRLEIAVAR